MNSPDHERSAGDRGAFLFAALLVAACARGDFAGEVADRAPAVSVAEGPPVPAHEQVPFTWESPNDSFSGRLQATLPSGEVFKGKFHEIVTNVPVDNYSDFYGSWYAGPWGGPSWYWGGAWPYYGTVDEFVTHYTGKVVARLTGDRGHEMRCFFKLNDRYAGLKGGGTGECQVSSGERITARFSPA